MTNIPALYYRLLKTDTQHADAGEPAHADDATARPPRPISARTFRCRSLTIAPIAQGGVNIQPQTQFDYRTIGVNIGITPRTHPNDDVTLALNIELSSLGAPGFDGPADVRHAQRARRPSG